MRAEAVEAHESVAGGSQAVLCIPCSGNMCHTEKGEKDLSAWGNPLHGSPFRVLCALRNSGFLNLGVTQAVRGEVICSRWMDSAGRRAMARSDGEA